MLSIRPTRCVIFAMVLTGVSAASVFSQTVGQSPQPRLEVLTRQGDFYWVVETATDGSRRGGWVNVSVPLDRIDRSAFQALPALPPLPNAPQRPDADRLNERLTRIEQAIAAGESAGPAVITQSETPVRSKPIAVAQPRPQTPAVGQPRPQTREGFWFNAGFGIGSAGCVGCVGREMGASGGLSLGGTISDRVLLGVGTTGWYKSVDGVAINGGTFDARIRVYPSLASGFFLTAGAGLGTIAVWDAFNVVSERGAGALFGVGWDMRVGRNVSLTPFYNGFAVGVTSGTYYVDQFGLGVTVH